MNQQVDILEDALHSLRIGDKVGREITAVKLHALDNVQGGFQSLRLFDRDDAFFADLVHRLGDDVTDRRVVIRGDGADLGDLFGIFGRFGEMLELADNRLDGLVDAPL